MNKILLLSCLLLLNSCGIVYQSNMDKLKETATEADYGNPPPENYKKIVETYIRELLKDPDSGQFRNWKEPYRCLYPSYDSMTMPKLGWCNYVEVNAKNGFGAYTGFSLWQIRWSGEKIYSHYQYHYNKWGQMY